MRSAACAGVYAPSFVTLGRKRRGKAPVRWYCFSGTRNRPAGGCVNKVMVDKRCRFTLWGPTMYPNPPLGRLQLQEPDDVSFVAVAIWLIPTAGHGSRGEVPGS